MNRLQSFTIFNVSLFIFLSMLIYLECSGGTHIIFSPFTNQRESRNCYPNGVHSDFSHQSIRFGSQNSRTLKKTNDINSYTAEGFQQSFLKRRYTESEILNQWCLYMSDEFVKYAQTYPGYKNKIREMYAELKNLNLFQKTCRVVKGTYCRKLQKRIAGLYGLLAEIKEESLSQGYYNLTDVAEKIYDPTISECFTEYETVESIYTSHVPQLAKAINTRSAIYKNSLHNRFYLQKTNQSYTINSRIKQLLSCYGYDANAFI